MAYNRKWRRCPACGKLIEISAGDGIPIDEDDSETDWVCNEKCKERYGELVEEKTEGVKQDGRI